MNMPQRRSRQETLEEDLTKLIEERNTNDEEVFPILREALNEGVDADLLVNGEILTCYFAFHGMLKCFEECILLGADPTVVDSDFSYDALVSAVSGLGSPPIVTRMVTVLLNNVSVNELNHAEALDLACDLGRFEVVRLLLRRDKSFFADRVLFLGIDFCSTQLVEIALEFNASVNQRQSDGRQLVHMAAELQDSSILQKLLDTGAKIIETKNKSTNETPFQVAVRFNSVNCVRLLISRKCEFSSEAALLLAIRCRSHDVLSELLRNEDFRRVVRQKGTTLLSRTIALGDLTAFRIVYPIAHFYLPIIYRLVRFQKYDLLSAALFEFEHPGLTTEDLTPLIAEAPNDNFKALLQRKIDAMNGVDLVVKVKKEEE